MNTTTTAAQLPSDVEALMRALRLPHARAIAPDVLATARAQRWDPTEVVKALLTEETAGRARSMLASRRKAAGFPTGKTFDVWDPNASSIPLPHPTGVADPGMGTAAREPGGLRACRHRKNVLPRSARAEGHRSRHAGGLVHPRADRGARPRSPGR